MQRQFPQARDLEEQFDRHLAEFIASTSGLIEPDPELGALIRAAYELDGSMPPLRLCKSAA